MRCTVAATSAERRHITPGEVFARLQRAGQVGREHHRRPLRGQKCARDDAAPRVKIFNSMIANIEEYRRQRVVQ